MTESGLSQYLRIAALFQKLKEIAPNEEFSTLRTWNVNRLYKLSELVDDSRLVDVARFFNLKSEVSLEEVAATVDSYLGVKVPFDQEDAASVSEQSSTPTEPTSPTPGDVSMKLCLRNAKKVGSLAAETHETLSIVVQELVQDTGKFSSAEILQILTKVLRTLRQLQKHSNLLKEKVKPGMQ